MLSPEQARDRAQDLIDRARRAGADAADAVYGASSSEGIQVRLGKLEDVERSESEHISLRVFSGRRSASIGSSDLSPQALDELAARAIDMARAAPEDEYAGLAPEELLSHAPWPELDLIDAAEPSPQALRQRAEEAEDAARTISGVTNSDGTPFELPDGKYYNEIFPGHAIGMAPPLSDGMVTYEDENFPQTLEQYSRDVSAFLMWVAEPGLVARKEAGFRVILFLILFAGLMWFVKQRLWAPVHHHNPSPEEVAAQKRSV